MRKLYQKSWHHINFSFLGKLSADKIADSSFYDTFYKCFFEKYADYDGLDENWTGEKKQYIHFFTNIPSLPKEASILSIGSGIGIVEKELLDIGYLNIDVVEVSNTPLLWLKKYLAPENIHVGFFPDCINSKKKYDLIYLPAIDYVFNKNEFDSFLCNVYKYLSASGVCMLISVSFDDDSFLKKNKELIKGMINKILHLLRIRSLGQFWGYIRTKKELRSALENAGFCEVVEIKNAALARNTYCLIGKNA